MKLTQYRKRHKQILLSQENLEEPFIMCPFCQSSSIDELGLIDKMNNIKVMQCGDCGIGFINRQPTESCLQDFYEKYYQEGTKHTTIDPARLASHILSLCKPVSRGQAFSILDFGGGDASVSIGIARQLTEQGIASQVTITLIDFFPSASSSDARILIQSLPSIAMIPQKSQFDLIIASAVLEHVKDPEEVLFSLLNLLGSEGRFYARTPHMYPIYKALWRAGINIGYPYPAHLFDMGAWFWQNVMKTRNKNNEFRVIRNTPSIVESRFSEHFLRTLLAYLLKAPSILFPLIWPFEGGREVLISRTMQ